MKIRQPGQHPEPEMPDQHSEPEEPVQLPENKTEVCYLTRSQVRILNTRGPPDQVRDHAPCQSSSSQCGQRPSAGPEAEVLLSGHNDTNYKLAKWEEIFTHHTSGIRLISTIYKELKKLDINKPNNPFKKWATDLNKDFSPEESQMAEKYLK